LQLSRGIFVRLEIDQKERIVCKYAINGAGREVDENEVEKLISYIKTASQMFYPAFDLVAQGAAPEIAFENIITVVKGSA
jgi:hypothetical protein